MIYRLLKNKITRGTYDKADILNKMDTYLLFNRITEEQYNELIALMGRWHGYHTRKNRTNI